MEEQIAVLEGKPKRIFYSFASKCSDKPLLNYQAPSLVYPKVEKFNRKFCLFVNGNNILTYIKNYRMPCITLNAMEIVKIIPPTYL
jgi:hypothetical protein